MNQMQFNNRLENRGYVRLGRGMYSSVYAKPGSSKVIKVGSTGDSWLGYIIWAMKEGYVGNHAPRVDSFKVNGQEDYFVAVMERLQKLNSKNRELMWDLIPDTRSFNENVPAEWKTFTKTFTAQFGDRNDMHDENWMQRSNGELGLTDPLSSGGQNSVSRYKSRPNSGINSLRNVPALVWC